MNILKSRNPLSILVAAYTAFLMLLGWIFLCLFFNEKESLTEKKISELPPKE